MSLAVFPTLPGIAYPIGKTAAMSTRALEAASGVEYRAQNWSAPRWKFSLPIEFLRQYASFSEWQTLQGFILAQAGMFNNFLFNDTTDNTVVNQQIGIGNGVQTAFPLLRTVSTFVEPIYYCTSLNAVYLNGVSQTMGFTLTQSGYYGPDTVTFSSAPASGVVVQASFNFNFVCRFLADDPDFQLFIGGRWSMKALTFGSCK
jgi:uncharacterized protein (TIGR02217 family)